MTDATPTLREQAERFPQEPGIYFFRNAKGRILYIGKAKNLRNRIFQYIRMTDGRRMVSRLLAQSRVLDFTITQSEKQALMLEAKQIQEHKPKFNIQLLDGRTFLHFHLDQTHDYPALTLTRFPKPRKGHRYFGSLCGCQSRTRYYGNHRQEFFSTCSDETLKERNVRVWNIISIVVWLLVSRSVPQSLTRQRWIKYWNSYMEIINKFSTKWKQGCRYSVNKCDLKMR